jgi:hypothetical protein
MCVHAFSAGAGAAAYALAWFGAGDSNTGFVDKVVFLSGPELADIKAGRLVLTV